MRERPILFSGEMVKAILDGKKTQTRRVVRPQPNLERDLLEPNNPNAYLFAVKTDVGTTRMLGRQNYVKEFSPFQVELKLWVRETWAEHPEVPSQWIYRADRGGDYQGAAQGHFKWKPSIFMPRWASRLTLEIVSVRIERLHDISWNDALAEGISGGDIPPDEEGPHRIGWMVGKDDGVSALSVTPQKAYEKLWDSLNRKTFPWSSNPFVFRIEFKRV